MLKGHVLIKLIIITPYGYSYVKRDFLLNHECMGGEDMTADLC